MPFTSDKQRRYLWKNKPEVARKLSKKQIETLKKPRGGLPKFKTQEEADRYMTKLLEKKERETMKKKKKKQKKGFLQKQGLY